MAVWRFDYRNGTWLKDEVHGKQRPPARRDHLAALDATQPNPSLTVFGGVSGGHKYLNDGTSHRLRLPLPP